MSYFETLGFRKDKAELIGVLNRIAEALEALTLQLAAGTEEKEADHEA